MESPPCRAWHVVSASAQEPLVLGTRGGGGGRKRASGLALNSKPRAGQRGAYLAPGTGQKSGLEPPMGPREQTKPWLWGWRSCHVTPEQDAQALPPMSRSLGHSHSCPWGIRLSSLQVEFTEPLPPLVTQGRKPLREASWDSRRKARPLAEVTQTA